MAEQRFIKKEHLASLITGDDPADLLVKLRNFTPPILDKWVDKRPAKLDQPTTLRTPADE